LYLSTDNKKTILKITGVVILTLSVALGSTVILHKPTNERFKVTLGLFSGDYDTIDKATALRLPIWKTAYTAFKDNKINGIGPRGFRYVYQDYAVPGGFWITQTHPHLLILEIMVETGVCGLLGYFILIYLLINGVFHRNKLKNELPFLIPVLVALFPFNAHMAFYGSIWSSMIWWLMAVYFSSIRLSEQQSFKS
jgi:O-antigen ligase